MNYTVLVCGHEFYWRDAEPDGPVYCSRCTDYREPLNATQQPHRRGGGKLGGTTDEGGTVYYKPLPEIEPRRPGKRLSKAAKMVIVELAMDRMMHGESLGGIAQSVGYAEGTVRTWINQFKRGELSG